MGLRASKKKGKVDAVGLGFEKVRGEWMSGLMSPTVRFPHSFGFGILGGVYVGGVVGEGKEETKNQKKTLKRQNKVESRRETNDVSQSERERKREAQKKKPLILGIPFFLFFFPFCLFLVRFFPRRVFAMEHGTQEWQAAWWSKSSLVGMRFVRIGCVTRHTVPQERPGAGAESWS